MRRVVYTRLFVAVCFDTTWLYTDDLLVNTELPIPEEKNLNHSDSADYKGIALSSIVGKIIDAHVITRFDSHLTESNSQFGYKTGFPSAICSMILQGTSE
jgi:ribonuclease HII